MAVLGNSPDAYQQTWHLPIDDNGLTYSEFSRLAAEILGVPGRYKILKRWQLWLASLLSRKARDASELLPRYEVVNIFVTDKFKRRFPDFRVTTFREGLNVVRDERISS